MTLYDEQRAWERVKKKKGFYKHASAFLGTGIGLFFLNIFTSPGDWWFQYTMASWGIGLAIHYFSVFGVPFVGALDDDWEQKEFEKEIERKQRMEYEPHTDEYLDLSELRPERRREWRDSDLV